MAKPPEALRSGDALIIVDVQKDFCPGGALPIEGGDEVITVLNRWIAAAKKTGTPVYASRDWHPVGHVSFEERGGPWPAHCIQDSDGARYHPDLELPEDAVKVTKGVRFDHDQNSVFDDTGLTEQLRRTGIERLWIGGLAQDVCVLKSVLDACEAGFEVHLIADAVRPVSREGGEKANRRMREAGAKFETTD